MANTEKHESSSLLNDEYVEPSPTQNFKKGFIEITKSPRDLWFLYAVCTLSITGLSVLFVSESTYVTEILGLSDIEYAYYGFFNGLSCLIYAFLFGNIPDMFGIRLSAIFSTGVGILLFILLLSIDSIITRILLLILLKNISGGVIYPAGKLGIQVYTNNFGRSLAYSIFAIIVFISQAIAALIDGIVFYKGNNEDEGCYDILFGISTSLLVLAMLGSLFLRKLDFDLRGEEILESKPIAESYFDGIKLVFKYRSFWRMVIVTFLLSMIWTTNGHLTATLPLYMDRDIEDNSDYGYVIAVSYASYAIFSPVMTILVYYYDTYTILLIGGLITSASPLILLLGAEYVYVYIFGLLLGLGGSIQYPRIIEYALLIAPQGREGYFFMMAGIPLLFGLMSSGLSSGLLLDKYCPEDGYTDCWAIWLWVSVISFLGTFLLFVCRKWLEQPAIEPNPFVSWWNEDPNDVKDNN